MYTGFHEQLYLQVAAPLFNTLRASLREHSLHLRSTPTSKGLQSQNWKTFLSRNNSREWTNITFCYRLSCQSWRCSPTLVSTPTLSTSSEPSHLVWLHVSPIAHKSSTGKRSWQVSFLPGELFLIVEYCRFGNLQRWIFNCWHPPSPRYTPFLFGRLILSKRASFISQMNPLSGRYDESHPPDLEEKLHSHR